MNNKQAGVCLQWLLGEIQVHTGQTTSLSQSNTRLMSNFRKVKLLVMGGSKNTQREHMHVLGEHTGCRGTVLTSAPL